MTIPASRATATGRRRSVFAVLLVAVVLSVLLVVAHLFGYTLNLTTREVTAPTSQATPEEVVTTYVEAYNGRDWSTMAKIYPSQRLPRFRHIGTIANLAVQSSRVMRSAEDGNPAVPGRSYYEVWVSLNLSGFDLSDLAYQPGPNEWKYLLERDGTDEPWFIADHGSG